jgi:MFS family permease
MRTGLPLYIVGTSTFGTKGGYFIPGIFMGLLQIGWYSVATFIATDLIINGLGLPAYVFYPMAIVWGLLFAVIGALGIGYVAKMSQFFPIVPIIMLLIGAVMALPYLGSYETPKPLPDEFVSAPMDLGMVSIASLLMIQLIVGFFGTAGAVGADFCSNNRNKQDVHLGGIVGIWLAVVYTAGLAVITVAGAHGANQELLQGWQEVKDQQGQLKYEVRVNPPEIKLPAASDQPDGRVVQWDGMSKDQQDDVRSVRAKMFDYGTALRSLNTSKGPDGKPVENWLARAMLILFAIGSMAPACFCSFIIGNSLSTMLAMPRGRIPITLAGAAVGIAIALTGFPAKLAPIFGLVGASFGPVIGAMIADYYLKGANWPAPREGWNWAGYGAWALGFLVGISNNELVSGILGFELVPRWMPTGVFSLIIGLLAYILLARMMGLPPVLEGAVKTIGPNEPAKA